MNDTKERAKQRAADLWNHTGQMIDAGVETFFLSIAVLGMSISGLAVKAADWYKSQQVPRETGNPISAKKPLTGAAK